MDERENEDAIGGVTPTPAGLQTDDGSNTGIEIDSSAQTDAVNPAGQYELNFEEGNFKTMQDLPNTIGNKSVLLTKTIVPLIEAGLIELLGNSSAYNEKKCDTVVTIDGNNVKFESDIVFTADLYIGTDIEQEAIASDAKYLLDKIKIIPNCEWTECSIDCAEGIIHLHCNY